MPFPTRVVLAGVGCVIVGFVAAGGTVMARQQPAAPAAAAAQPPAPTNAAPPGPPQPTPAQMAAQEAAAADHKNMMDQLGIKALRPGPSGNEQAPNHANYDESKANPYPNLPDVLTLKNGKKVTTAAMWWNAAPAGDRRGLRPRGLGRVPKNVPKVTWEVTRDRRRRRSAAVPVVTKQLVGHVDNSRLPGDQGRHPDDARHAGRRARARCR